MSQPLIAPPTSEPKGCLQVPIPLEQARQGQEVVLADVQAPPAMRHRLAEMGLRAGVRLTVTGGGKGGPIILAIGDTRLVLGQGLGHCVRVYPQI
jgi:Fe2+ transport system protein FeoA